MSTTISTITPISEFRKPRQITPPEAPPSTSQSTQKFNRGTDADVNQRDISKESISVDVEDITDIDEISPAVAVSDAELSCFHVIRYILHTHKSLSEEEINYAANFVSSFYAHSYDKLQLRDKSFASIHSDKLNTAGPSVQQNLDTENLLTDDQLVMFLVYADQSGISKFALTFNEELDNAIKAKDENTLKRILLGPKEMFVELYDNTFLSTEDREFIIRLIARESFAAILALELIKKKILNLESIDDKCTAETFTVTAEKLDNKIQVTTIATKCYDEVCIQDAKILEDDPARAIMSKYEKPPESIFTVDKPESDQTPSVYCFSTLDLIDAVTEEIPINPKTGEPFSNYALKIIKDRFHKEIDMYRRYKQNKK
ncbi:Hypothetical protein HVR_LOCUS1298 [uncultured virus]|nr:Hypothetical protein HVR_LOCUS1298 [uncultured virus]